MKKEAFTLIVVFILTFNGFLNAQAPGWEWSNGPVGVSLYSKGISTDANGNTVITGIYYGPSIIFGSNTLTTTGNGDVFVVKYNPSGNVVWAKSASGTGEDIGRSISTDASGNIFVTGYFDGPSITFGSITLTNTSTNLPDIFVVKYNPLGTVLWAKKAGGASYDSGNSINTDVNGNVLLTGDFSSPTIGFSNITLTNTPLGAQRDVFIAKYDTYGNVLWAKSAGGWGDDHSSSICTDANGNVFITGSFQLAIGFGSTTLTSSGTNTNNDIFITKYNPSGNVIWAKSAIGNSTELSKGISADLGGNVLVTGYFDGPTISFGNTILNNAGANSSWDIFVAKYDPSGNVVWAKGIGGTRWEEGIGIKNDQSGNVFILGQYDSFVLALGNTTLTSSSPDIIIIKLDPAGNVVWAKSAGGAYSDNPTSLSVDPSGNVLLTGDFDPPSITFGSTTLSYANGSNIFVAKLGVGSTGILEESNLETISIYPIPFSETVFLQSENILKDATISIYNAFGKMEKQIQNVTGQMVTIHCEDLPEGIYILRLEQKNFVTRTKKLLISN